MFYPPLDMLAVVPILRLAFIRQLTWTNSWALLTECTYKKLTFLRIKQCKCWNFRTNAGLGASFETFSESTHSF